ncbi:(2Fe-2S)-binding protein [Sorangium cellulosum]|uniref:(2Fe-2S)-binding protein n=1 Tax=Sorangium cellulosum TaxID=56 RepID=A0A4P2Q974_SORCE|nr:Rieske 2Fe-2S domain-containing protein [Sorangium cellulosum]AUX25623.1 (2Fe-2S)-binding protein [Sorangium cellulosum]
MREHGIEEGRGSFIEGAWYIIADASTVGKRPVTVERFGARIVLFRDERGALVAARARCPHRGADLGLGRVVDGAIECPYHGFRFAADGRCVAIPCEGRAARVPGPAGDGDAGRARDALALSRFEVREHRGLVWLFWGERPAELPPVPWFDGLPPDERHAHTATMEWDVPFARAMEGMLDIHHLPFAHRPWAVGVGALLDPYEVRTEGDSIHTEGVLRHDDGRPWDGRRGWKFTMEVCFPGVLCLSFGGRALGVAACAPIDARRTAILGRYYVPIPVLGRLVAWLAVMLELRLIQPGDERMLASSEPLEPDLDACRFVRADAGILAWHKLRRARLKAPRAEAPRRLPVAAG